MTQNMERDRGKGGAQRYRLEIPLDASAAVGEAEGEVKYQPEQPVKVVVQLASGELREQVARLDAKGQGIAGFEFEQAPGSLHVMVGPGEASSEEMLGLQTLTFDLPARQWGNRRELVLRPVTISAFLWFWWWRWCRTFTIRGRVVCPDGLPVPGAQVCAFDVDWWFLWSSTQQVGCATTDINGDFSITFRWCCGWWPWWWWRTRIWRLDPDLVERVNPILEKIPRPDPPPLLTNQPSLAALQSLLGSQTRTATRALSAGDTGSLEGLRAPLLKHLPASSELERLRIWPWWPWQPWWDCTPDIIFKVTQNCVNQGEVILNETIANTRWNISNPLNVVLVAGENACCRPGCPEPPCEGGECLVIDGVCGIPIDQIGGNLSAPATPAGYAYPGAVTPGAVAYNGDRPFAETVTVTKNPGELLGVDYYEIEVYSGGSWNPLPAGAALNFQRNYWDTGTSSTGWAGFPFTTISGHNVCETREHYEANSGLTWDFPGADRWWLSYNYSTLVPLDTTLFADGTYSFRVVGWQLAGGGLVNPKVIPVCGTEKDNNLILTFDNRVITPLGHPPSHNCGTVHICTLEPDTDISAVRVNGNLVGTCDTVTDREGTVEIDFMVSDPDGHLAYYTLMATYGLNQEVNLLAQPGAVLTPLGSGVQVGPTYGQALGQGAAAPTWKGGQYRLTLPLAEAFPEPCCYQLVLQAFKRTIVSCDGDFSHWNQTEYSIGVGVC